MLKLLLFITFTLSALCSYDPDYGFKLCKLTVASYCAPHKVKDWTCKPCNDSPIKLMNVSPFYNSTGDVLGIIGNSESPKGIYLVFRGTLPWDVKNWIQDINFIKTKYPNCNNSCEVHRGFYHAFLDVAPQVLAAVKDYRTRLGIQNVIVTGHSLGGALATHAAAHLIANGIAVENFYTFGAPRVGDQKFAQWFDAVIKTNIKNRITHGRDPVPHLPFHDWGFIHAPHQIFYHSTVKQGYVVCNDNTSKEDPNCSDKYKEDVMVTDHITYYDIDYTAVVLECQ